MQRIPTYREILAIALPMMIGSISESISSFVDTAFMGSLGTLELDGMGMANMYIMLIFMIGWSLSRGVQILVSQNYGANNDENIADVMYNILLVIIPVSIILMLFLYFFSGYFLDMVISNPEISKIATHVFKIRSIGIPLVLLISVYSSFYTGISNTKILIYSQGLVALLNIALNYCLVFGNLGLPKMGYKGSATATVISELIGLMILIGSLLYKTKLKNKYKLFTIRKMQKNIISSMASLSYPLLIQSFVSLGAWIVFFTLIEKMGEKELAISLIIKQLFVLIILPNFCLGNTANTLVGKAIGERQVESVIRILKKVIKVNIVLMFVLTVLTYIFRMKLAAIFTSDPYVLENFSNPMIMLLSAIMFMSIGSVIFNSITALGDTKISLYLESFVIVAYSIYLYFIMIARKATLVVAWSSELVYWGFMIIFTVLYFKFIDWRNKIIYHDQNES